MTFELVLFYLFMIIIIDRNHDLSIYP